MAKLCANINMFTMSQNIFFADEDGVDHIASVSLNKIGETMYSLIGARNGIEEIALNGNQDFIQQIGYEILEGLEKNYSDRNVRIRLNGKIFN